jgi:hypothetical protein
MPTSPRTSSSLTNGTSSSNILLRSAVDNTAAGGTAAGDSIRLICFRPPCGPPPLLRLLGVVSSCCPPCPQPVGGFGVGLVGFQGLFLKLPELPLFGGIPRICRPYPCHFQKVLKKGHTNPLNPLPRYITQALHRFSADAPVILSVLHGLNMIRDLPFALIIGTPVRHRVSSTTLTGSLSTPNNVSADG